MKKKIVLLLLTTFISLSLFACDNNPANYEEVQDNQQNTDIDIESREELIVVSDLLTCPQFTEESQTFYRINQISRTAKEYAPDLTEDQTSQIISIIREANPQFYNGPEEMEKFMWYGFLLDYKYDDSDSRSQLGTDLCQAIKYVYSNVETVLDDSTRENLSQINETLGMIP